MGWTTATARRWVAVTGAVLAVAGVAACGDDDGGASGSGSGSEASSTTAPATSSTATAPARIDVPVRFDERGPYDVGATSLALDDGRRVVVWYPAEAGAGGEEQFDIAALLSPELQAQIPEGGRPLHPVAAATGAPPAADDGPYPVVLFSHGFAGFPEQSAHLTTHLASWGFVVAAPDHVERSLGGMLGTAAAGVTPREDPEVLAATLDLVVAESSADGGSPLAGLVDGERVAVSGHSAGAGATWALAGSDPRIDAFIAYSVGRRDEAGVPTPAVPGMVMLGTEDGVIPADATRAAYESLAPPRTLVEIEAAGHLVFSDICLIGAGGGGVIAIAHSIGLDIPADFDRLGTDGCGPDAPVVEAFPAIEHLSVAFLRAHLLGDDTAASFEPEVMDEVAGDVAVSVTVED